MKKSKFWQIFTLSLAVLAVVIGGICFMGGVAGWFDQPSEVAILDSEYRGNSQKIPLDVDTLNNLLAEQKSFIVISYLPTCTADILSFMEQYANTNNISYYWLNWTDLQKTSFSEKVKFSPSVIVVSKGKIIDHLQADSDAYLEQYNNYNAFSAWLNSKIQ